MLQKLLQDRLSLLLLLKLRFFKIGLRFIARFPHQLPLVYQLEFPKQGSVSLCPELC